MCTEHGIQGLSGDPTQLLIQSRWSQVYTAPSSTEEQFKPDILQQLTRQLFYSCKMFKIQSISCDLFLHVIYITDSIKLWVYVRGKLFNMPKSSY
jgi:hypothetical protein